MDREGRAVFLLNGHDAQQDNEIYLDMKHTRNTPSLVNERV
jgi:hypothetical protein